MPPNNISRSRSQQLFWRPYQLSLRPWMAFISLIHLLCVYFYYETSSPTAIFSKQITVLQGAYGAATRANAFMPNKIARIRSQLSQWRLWIALTSLFHVFWVCYYWETSSPSPILVIQTTVLQGTLGAATRANAFRPNKIARSRSQQSQWRPWMACISLAFLFWVYFYS